MKVFQIITLGLRVRRHFRPSRVLVEGQTSQARVMLAKIVSTRQRRDHLRRMLLYMVFLEMRVLSSKRESSQKRL